ncbi:antitoxin Xre-like helix-turn-helix domain-containing protein [Nibrella saemangeumensis]
MQTAFSIPSGRPVTDLIRQTRQGVMRRRVDEVARLVGLTDREMARILNMSVRSLHSASGQ